MKVAIYLRTSTTEQTPGKQKEACVKFAESRGYTIEGIYQEELSAFKDIDRPQYELIKKKAYEGEIKAVIVWALDRWVRNRDTLLDDVTALKQYGVKLHSVQEQWLEAINIEGSLGKTIQEFLLGLIGSLAEMESQKKSERVKMAYNTHTGKKWGRKTISKQTQDNIIELHKQGISQRQISKQVFYYDKNNNKKLVSLGCVHKTITNFKELNQ